MAVIKSISYQIMDSLVLLSDKRVGICHCDIKPENILLEEERCASVKLIDFGSSCTVNRPMYTYVQSRYYRSPEVLLGLNYDTQIDIWSLGCVIAEMYNGYPLFPGTSEEDQLYKIIQICGMPSQRLIEHSKRKNDFFEYNKETRKYRLKRGEMEMIKLEDKLKENPDITDVVNYRSFIALLKKIFVIDPRNRITPKQAKYFYYNILEKIHFYHI